MNQIDNGSYAVRVMMQDQRKILADLVFKETFKAGSNSRLRGIVVM